MVLETESEIESETEQSQRQFITAVAEMGISSSRDSLPKGNWADLPIEILDNEMLSKVGDVEDSIRFGAVSRSWRSALVESKNTNNSFVPWVMLAESEQEQPQEEGSNNKDVRKFFNLSTKKTIELYLPEAQGRRCLGSTSGWILTLGLDLNIHLLNSLTRLQISLPPQPTFEKQFHYTINGREHVNGEPAIHHLRRTFIEKFALSTHPNTNRHDGGSSSATVMVVADPHRTLYIARPGDPAWTHVECTRRAFDDVIFFNNLFYAVHHGGYVVVCDITTNPVPVATDFMPLPFPLTHSIKYYLVEMSSHLHMVVRRFKIKRDVGSISTLQFRVYKLDFSRKQWIELQNLGDYALFLGNNYTFAINHPHLGSNCIYFTDDHSEYHKCYDGRDMGVFDFGEKKIVPGGKNIFDFTGSIDCIHSTFCTPLYFIPNLH